MGKNINKEMQRLKHMRDTVKKRMEDFYKKYYYDRVKREVYEWLEDVEKLENKLESIQQTIASEAAASACLNCIVLRCNKPAALVNLENRILELKVRGNGYYTNWCVRALGETVKRGLPTERKSSIEIMLKSQTKLLRDINLLVHDKTVSVIGVWGMAGVGKTVLMKVLNNRLLKEYYNKYHLLIYVTGSQPLDLGDIQRQIGRRFGLNLAQGIDLPTGASLIRKRLMHEKEFLIIFDGIWKAFNLCDVGVPRCEVHAGCKVIITSRDKNVCTYISKDVKLLKVDTLNEEESWELLVRSAGDVANSVHIEQIAREITRKCGGLPLAIECYGLSLKNQNNVARWTTTLESLRMSEPDCPSIDKDVFRIIKRSYDSFEGESMCKGGDDIQKCFLDCMLYAENYSIPIDTLVHSWHKKGYIGKNIKEDKVWYTFGIDFVQRLINASLLEQDDDNSVKMHALVRHVAIWIAKDKSAYYDFF